LVLLASTLAVGVSTATSTTAQLGFLLFGVPFIATITAAAVSLHVSSRGSPTDAPPPPDPAPRPRQALGGLVVGAALVAAAAVVATVLEPQTRALYPTPAERVAVLETRITAATNAVVAISQEPDDTSGARIDGLWQAERDWLRDNPAPDCAGSAWARWQDTLDDVREVGLIVTAALTVDAGTPTELAQLQAKLEALPPQAAAHEQATAEALAEAREACAG
jgi:hypothetical protein